MRGKWSASHAGHFLSKEVSPDFLDNRRISCLCLELNPRLWIPLNPTCLATQEIPTYYEIHRYITAFTNGRDLSLSLDRAIQSIPPHPTFWRSNITLPPTSRFSKWFLSTRSLHQNPVWVSLSCQKSQHSWSKFLMFSADPPGFQRRSSAVSYVCLNTRKSSTSAISWYLIVKFSPVSRPSASIRASFRQQSLGGRISYLMPITLTSSWAYKENNKHLSIS